MQSGKPVFSLVAIALGLALPRSSYSQNENERQFDTDQRVPWTISRIQGSPDPPSPYRTVNAFPGLKFNEPLAMTNDGRVFSGLLVEQTETRITLKDAENNTTQIAAADVEVMAPQLTSLMPELLLREMTGQQVADLLEFLGGLR